MEVPPQVSSNGEQILLTTVDGTRINAIRTTSPWRNEFDAIVIPVGSGRYKGYGGNFAQALYGAIGSASEVLAAKFDSVMSTMPDDILTPDHPALIRMSQDVLPEGIRTHNFIIATAFNSQEVPSTENARIAAQAIVKLVAHHGLSHVAIVPLGSGAGELSESKVYRAMVAGVRAALPAPGVEEITFVSVKEQYVRELQALFLKRPQPFQNDLAVGDDLLGVATEVSALSDALLMRGMTPPLAVGILGGWGSGKTFAMHLMQEEMARIRSLSIEPEEAWPESSKGDTFPYVGHVYMVRFDAWTYAKSNLWSSLMQSILHQLNQQFVIEKAIEDAIGEEDAQLCAGNIWRCIYGLTEEQRDVLLNDELGKKVLDELESVGVKDFSSQEVESLLWENLKKVKQEEREELEKAERELRKRRAELVKKQRALEEGAKEQAVAQTREAIVRAGLSPLSDEVLKRIGNYVQMETGIDLTNLNQALALSPQREDVVEVVQRDPLWYVGFAVFLCASIVGPVLAQLGVPIVAQFDWTELPVFMVAFISFALIVIKFAHDWKGMILHAVTLYQTRVAYERERLGTEPDQDLLKKQEEVKDAQDAVVEAEGRVARHRERLGLTAQYQTLHQFIEDRLRDGTYEVGLGPMHRIQRDIQEITEGFTLAKNDPRGDEKKQLFPRGPARVVLFIDDLDRCPPDKVVEMLEAVQILIKTSLFVVVMAMDVRFITRALEKSYAGILIRKGDPSGLDYIEKIIQIPYRIRPIEPEAVRTYLSAQMMLEETERESEETLAIKGNVAGNEGGRDGAASSEVEQFEALPRAVIRFTPREFESVERACKQIDLTPRSVKRLVNIYKTLKIIWFRSSRHKDPDVKLEDVVVALLALSARYPDLMRHVLRELDGAIKHLRKGASSESLSGLRDFIVAEAKTCDNWECERFVDDVKVLIPEGLTVKDMPRTTLGLVRSFSFVGDLGYSPADRGSFQRPNISLKRMDTLN